MDRGKARVRALVTVAAGALLMSAIAAAQSPGPVNRQDVGFIETDLVANVSPLTDSNGIVHIPKPCTAVTNPPPCVYSHLLNPWGLVGSTPVPSPPSTPSPWWISDNGQGVSTLYNDDTVAQTFTINPRVVFIPTAGNPTCTIPPAAQCGTPTGIVWNIAPASPPAFQISGLDASSSQVTAPSNFIWATEDGLIVGWSNKSGGGVNPPGFNNSAPFVGNYGIIAVNHSASAVYKGLAIATDSNANTWLYAPNFRQGTVEVYDTGFNQVTWPGAFSDPKLPPGYAPFNIVLVGNRLIVTYAVQDPAMHDDVAGAGHGIVNSFDLSGFGLKRLVTGIAPGDNRSCRNPSTLVKCKLNSPWGVALAPQSFGKLANALLIGNFGDGRINGFDATTGAFIGTMHYGQSTPGLQGKPVVIDGLWALKVGNDHNGKSGYANVLYFTAGPNGEADGLFGALTPDGLYGTPPYPFPGP
jgi:uncharacterized protein (TIGR03118 family)